MRGKKKLEADIRELEVGLDRVSRDNHELQSNLKTKSATIRNMQQQIELEREEKQRAKELQSFIDRKISSLSMEKEEADARWEQADKSTRQAQLEVSEVKEKLHKVTVSRDGLNVIKRNLEGLVASLQTELEECTHELKNLDVKMKRAMEDAANLEKDLKVEQDISRKHEAGKKKAEEEIRRLKVCRLMCL